MAGVKHGCQYSPPPCPRQTVSHDSSKTQAQTENPPQHPARLPHKRAPRYCPSPGLAHFTWQLGKWKFRSLGRVWVHCDSLPIPNTTLPSFTSGTLAVAESEMRLVPIQMIHTVFSPNPLGQGQLANILPLLPTLKSVGTYSSLVIGCNFQWSSSSSKKDLFIILLFSSRGIKFSIIRCL